MKVQLAFVPTGGGEPNRSLDFDMPGVPQSGDHVTILWPGQSGSADFIVRRAWWTLASPEARPTHRADEAIVGTTDSVTVECEFAVGSVSSEEHKGFACGIMGA